MENLKLVTLVSYCSNEKAYIVDLLNACVVASDYTCVAVGNRLFDGTPEDPDDVYQLAKQFPTIHFVVYDVPEDLQHVPIQLHNRARIAAYQAAKKVCPHDEFWTLFLDSDEVPRRNGRDLREWWTVNAPILDKSHAYKLACFWYFLGKNLVSQGYQDSMVLAHSSQLTQLAMNCKRERDGICYQIKFAGGEVHRFVRAVDGRPMFDHFAWVRNGREGLLKKVKNWGHLNDKNWTSLINLACDKLENGEYPTIDFIHGWKVFRVNHVDSDGFAIPGHSATTPAAGTCDDMNFYVYHTKNL